MLFVILLWLKILHSCSADDSSHPKTTICVKRNFLNVDSPISTDSSTFLEFVNKSDIYIDRSLLIKEILKVRRPLIRITYPRKWGKSTCLHMLKTFFELDTEVLKNKSIEYPLLTERPSYKYFTQGKISSTNSNSSQELKNPPLISNYEHIIAKYLGKYPVIYLDLSDCKGKNIEILLGKIEQAFNKTYQEHSYLKDAITNSKPRRLMNSLLTSAHYNESMIITSLRFLSRMLCKYNDKKSFIFIDGYDTIINEVHFGTNSKFEPEDKERIVNLLVKLLQNTFIDNDFLEKGIITGVFEVLQHKCFNSTKYVKPFNLLNPSEFFALDENVVRQIFQQMNLPSELSEKAIHWYGGYKMNENQYSLLNPRSVAEFLRTKQLACVWSGTFLQELLFNLMVKNDHVACTLRSLIEGARRSISIPDLDFNEEELAELGTIVNGSLLFRSFDEKIHTLLFSYLYAAGFLTLSEDIQIIKQKLHVSLRIPNEEVSRAVSLYIDEFCAAMNSTTTTPRPTEFYYDDTFVMPVILEKEAMRISHKPREYKLI
ncbi:uncharacterized protein LOC135849765 [Planococcus citri]|uniref:uncharacterized protein LOC135849765 n=1 Tax=Planococcus citri TaxID=170843 RepID=UPI0031F8876A